MDSAGLNKTVLLGELARAPQLYYGPGAQACALLSVTTRVPQAGAHRELTCATLEDAHLVYCHGSLAERAGDLASGALLYIEGRNREQRMKDAGGKTHRVAFVSASVVRHLNDAPAVEGANTVTLLGTVMVEPIVRYGEEGPCESVKVRLMTIHPACDDGSDASGTPPEYHTISFYGRLAQSVAGRVRAGSLVFIDGRNRPSHWQDQEGVTHRTIAIVGHSLQLLQAEPSEIQPPERTLEVARGYDVQLPQDEAPAR